MNSPTDVNGEINYPWTSNASYLYKKLFVSVPNFLIIIITKEKNNKVVYTFIAN